MGALSPINFSANHPFGILNRDSALAFVNSYNSCNNKYSNNRKQEYNKNICGPCSHILIHSYNPQRDPGNNTGKND